MIQKKKAAKISALSALAVALIHYMAHHFGLVVWQVGLVVFASVFIIGYYGMTWGADKV